MESFEKKLMGQFRVRDCIMNKVIDKKVACTGVYRGQHQMLMLLGSRPEYSQVELAEEMKISPAAVATTLRKLEEAGYITREYKEGDKRVKNFQVTEKGKNVICQSIRIFGEIEEKTFAGFSREEMEQLSRFLERIQRNMEDLV